MKLPTGNLDESIEERRGLVSGVGLHGMEVL
jgi:hypothetical protein